jgi:hypothetical protein
MPNTTSKVGRIVGQVSKRNFRILARIVIAGNGRRMCLEI